MDANQGLAGPPVASGGWTSAPGDFRGRASVSPEPRGPDTPLQLGSERQDHGRHPDAGTLEPAPVPLGVREPLPPTAGDRYADAMSEPCELRLSIPRLSTVTVSRGVWPPRGRSAIISANTSPRALVTGRSR